jgi:hypothetical protein
MHLGAGHASRGDGQLLLQLCLQHRWSWKTLEPQQQRLLLDWTPMNEHAERQKRHKDMADKVIKEVGQGH